MGYFGALNALGGVVLAGTFLAGYRFGRISLSRRAVVWLGTLFLFLSVVEFFVFGKLSFISGNDLFMGFSVNGLYNRIDFGDLFSPLSSSGFDVYAASIFRGSLISLDGMILGLFPFWIANSIHQILVFSCSFIGAYLFFRGINQKASRGISFSLAVLYCYSQSYIFFMSWNHGLGAAVIPLMAYLIFIRRGRPHYWAGVILVSILAAISSTPTHSELTLMMGLLCVGILHDGARLHRYVGPVAVHVVLLSLNWFEALYAKAQYSKFSLRGVEEITGIFYPEGTVFYALAAVGLVFCWLRARDCLPRCAAAVLAALCLWLPIAWLANNVAVLHFFSAINFSRMSYCFPLIAAAVFSLGWTRFSERGRVWKRAELALPVALASIAVATLAWHKAYNFSNWLSAGGLSPYVRLDRDLGTFFNGDAPGSRMTVVPYRIEDTLAASLGYPTFAGHLNLIPAEYERYIEATLKRDIDLKCCESIDVSGYADLDLLRIAHTGYIGSYVPLTGKGVTQVYGPEGANAFPRNSQPVWERLGGYVAQIFDHAPFRIYALERPLDEVFAVKGILAVPDDTDDDAMIRAVRENALDGVAVVREGRLPADARIGDLLAILGFQEQGDDFKIRVSAPEAGIVALNTPFVPFWRAYADGKEVPVFPINAIHTAACVGAGTKALEFRYRRPSLFVGRSAPKNPLPASCPR